MKWIFIFLIRFYQVTLSRIFPSCCKYTPTCSDYFIEALKKKGVIKGFFMGVWRILRCNPFSKGGYDPVE